MNNTELIALIVLIVVAVLAISVLFSVNRTRQLRSHFGPEYDRTVKESGSRARAEAELLRRKKRVAGLSLRPLTREDVARYTDSWSSVQAHFVDDPSAAVAEADRLLGDIMSRRGYPVTDFDQRAEDISVSHPRVVEHYRAGHQIALRHAKGDASTEDLRQAMIHYRSLFNELTGRRELTTARFMEREEPERRKAV